jgi:DNA replication protein DnaD
MADKSKGWVLLYRSIRDGWLWSIKPFDPARAWIDLILDANHDDAKIYINGKLVTVKRGQTWTSVRVLAERWGWGPHRVINFIRTLESEGMVTRFRTKSGTLLTLVNYSDFQGRGNTQGTQTATLREHRQQRNKEGEKEHKEGEKEIASPDGGKIEAEEDWFASLEDERELEHDTD